MHKQLNKILHNKTIRNGGLFSLFSFFNRGIGFLLLMLLAKYIEPQEYGELSMFNTLVMFLGYFVGLNSAGYLGISFFRSTKEDFRKDVTAIVIITFIVSAFFLAAFSLTSQWLSAWLHVSVTFLFIGLLVSFSNLFVQLNLDYLRVQERISWYGVLSCGFALLNFALTLYLVIARGQNWQGRVYAQMTCDILFGIVAIVWFYKDRLFALPESWCRYKKILLWSLPLIPHNATGWMKQGLDRYIINGSHTMEDVGLFSFALNIASIIIIIGTAFNQTNSVNLYQTLSDKHLTNKQKLASLKRKEKWFTVVYFMASVAILISGVVVIPIAMPSYTASIPYFSILVFYGLAQCIYFLHCNYLFYFDKTRQLMYITFCTAVLHVVLSYTFTRYSLYCTCAVNVVSQVIVTWLVIRKSNKVIKENIQ